MTFEVRNLYIAAALCALGRQLIAVTPNGDGRHSFVFADEDRQCAALEHAYNHDALTPPQPRALFAAMFAVRRAMYALTD